MERMRGMLLEFRLKEAISGELGCGMKDKSRRELRYCVRLVAISERV